MFPEYQPACVPFGLNGGGIFYAYDYRSKTSKPLIVATSASCLDWQDTVVLGDSLAAVFLQETNIENEFY